MVRPRVPGPVLALVLGPVVLRRVVRLGHRSGVSDAELAAPLPGDDVVPAATVVVDRAVVLPAPPAVVWPWLVQLGRHRGGWYAPRWVELAVPRPWRALRAVDPQWQHLAVGDEVPDWGPRTAAGEPTFVVVALEEPRTIAYRSDRPRGDGRPPLVLSWVLAVRPDGAGTRVHLRLRLGGSVARFPALVGTLGGLVDWATVVVLGAGLAERLRERPPLSPPRGPAA